MRGNRRPQCRSIGKGSKLAGAKHSPVYIRKTLAFLPNMLPSRSWYDSASYCRPALLWETAGHCGHAGMLTCHNPDILNAIGPPCAERCAVLWEWRCRRLICRQAPPGDDDQGGGHDHAVDQREDHSEQPARQLVRQREGKHPGPHTDRTSTRTLSALDPRVSRMDRGPAQRVRRLCRCWSLTRRWRRSSRRTRPWCIAPSAAGRWSRRACSSAWPAWPRAGRNPRRQAGRAAPGRSSRALAGGRACRAALSPTRSLKGGARSKYDLKFINSIVPAAGRREGISGFSSFFVTVPTINSRYLSTCINGQVSNSAGPRTK